jgi:hypothetical protein
VPAEEEELTWEEDDPNESDAMPLSGEGVEKAPGQEPDKPKQTTPSADQGAEAIGESEEAELVTQTANGHSAEGQSGEEAGEELGGEGDVETGEDDGADAGEEVFEHSQDATHDHPEEVQEEGQEADRSPGTSRDDIAYPSITVQYKGEEFPCFSSSDGFFTGTSVLRESIERLLAGFRAELAAELAPDEELVFHVDELGLEFAEVCATPRNLTATPTNHCLVYAS